MMHRREKSAIISPNEILFCIKTFSKFKTGLYKIIKLTIVARMKVSKTTPAMASFIFPASLLYSGEIKSINFSKPILNNSRITTRNETIIIVIKYIFETFKISAMKIAKIPKII